ncbi:MAG: lipopolysaccharide heptosyltransferase II [Mariprofundaceae bacterium]|nr:lipopolysaccharide heptosyltransferase II [Mariprofundaceae bacterium]
MLIITPNWLGDVIMAQPAIHALSASQKSPMVLYGKPWLRDLLPLLNLGDATYSDTLKVETQSAVLFTNSVGSAWRLFRSGAKHRIGFDTEWRGFLLDEAYTPSLDMRTQHHREYFLDLVEQMQVPVPQRDVSLQVSAQMRDQGEAWLIAQGLDPQRTVCVAAGAEFGAAKRYPATSYSKVLKQLSDEGWQILMLGTDGERKISDACLLQISHTAFNAAGKTTLTEALAVISASRMLLCNDSGLMHVAAGMQKPVVGIFGATDPLRTRPSGQHVHLLYEPAACSPCLKRECGVVGHPCMNNLSAEFVAQTCLNVLS